MKRIVILYSTLLCVQAHSLAEDPVYFTDMNLKAAVEAELGILDPTPSDMLALTNLKARKKDITSLDGMEYARNLEGATFRWNEITDITPLRGLRELTSLDLSQNEIVDISAVSKFDKLTRLDMHMNEIHDISAIDDLTELRYLDIHYNHIEDISALSELNRLQSLYLFINNISDLSPLSGLTELQYLDLMKNKISDISPLLDLNKLIWLRLSRNSIQEISPLNGLSRLRYLHLSSNQVEDVTPLSCLATLADLYLHDNVIRDVSAFTNLHKLTKLYLYKNPLNIAAHTIHLDQIVINNPGIVLRYDPYNHPPVAYAGENQAVAVGETVYIDGTGSYDPEGEELLFQWSFSIVPEKSDTILLDCNASDPNFFADANGTYMVDLVVNDSIQNSDVNSVTIDVLWPLDLTEIIVAEVNDALQEIIDDTPNTDVAEKAEDAYYNLLIVSAELNYPSPDIQAAFRNVEESAGDWAGIVNDGFLDVKVGTQLIESLTYVAKLLAMEAIDRAMDTGSDLDLINEAQYELNEGNRLKASGLYVDARSRYKDALTKAEASM